MSKYISIIICLGAFQLSAMAQKIKETDVPTIVRDNLAKMYGSLVVDEWSIENGNYEATFQYKELKTSALYDVAGKFLEYEYAITANDIPETTRNYFINNLPGKKMGEITKIKSASGVVSYEVEVDEQDYVFDINGNFIKIEKETNHDANEK